MMNLYLLLIMIVQLILASTPVYANNQSNGVGLEKMVVVGTVPGPDLWRVSKGDHELWILGTITPLPKKMDWNSKPIEKVIQSSQAFMLPPSFFISLKEVGFFKKLSLMKSGIGIKNSPDKQKLEDILPADLYSRWLVLKKKYIGKSRKVEKTRPIFASQKLYDKALKKTGLTRKTGITKKLKKMARKNKLKIIHPSVEVGFKDPKSTIKKFKKTQMNDIDCFTKTLETIESDLATMSVRAEAWSYGDIETIRTVPYTGDSRGCISTVFNSDIGKDLGMTDLDSQISIKWLEEAKSTLAEHKSTFAVMPISSLLSDEGILNELRSAGYKVEAPNTVDEI